MGVGHQLLTSVLRSFSSHSPNTETGAAAIARHRSLPVERRNARRPRRNVL
jgi:hypothetical protein